MPATFNPRMTSANTNTGGANRMATTSNIPNASQQARALAALGGNTNKSHPKVSVAALLAAVAVAAFATTCSSSSVVPLAHGQQTTTTTTGAPSSTAAPQSFTAKVNGQDINVVIPVQQQVPLPDGLVQNTEPAGQYDGIGVVGASVNADLAPATTTAPVGTRRPSATSERLTISGLFITVAIMFLVAYTFRV